MAEKTGRIIRLIYNIIFSLLTIFVAALFIYEVCDIYFGSGGGTFTRAVVGEHLSEIAIPVWVWIAMVLIGLVLWEVFPPKGKKKYGQDVRYSLYRLKKKMPVKAEGDLLEDAAAVAKYERFIKIVWCVAAVGCLVFAAVGLAYMLDFSHFRGDNVTQDVKTAIIRICPFVVCSFALCIGAVIYQGWGAKKELPHVKKLVALGKKQESKGIRKLYYTAVAAVQSDTYIWMARTVLFIAGVLLVMLGIMNDGAGDVLLKAVNICTECIGLG
ncbi:MAG: hypothetical protein LUI60_04485 [Clostridia bacterium]|nr:hypothetical protein [Clostridia bacterium]